MELINSSNLETTRIFCFFKTKFQETKLECINCLLYKQCIKDAWKMRKRYGKLLWKPKKLSEKDLRRKMFPELKNHCPICG